MHSWLLQRIATRVISIFTFVGEKYPVNSTHAEFMPALVRVARSSNLFQPGTLWRIFTKQAYFRLRTLPTETKISDMTDEAPPVSRLTWRLTSASVLSGVRNDRRACEFLALKSKSIMSGRRHGNRVGRAPHNRQNESKPGVRQAAVGLMMTSITWATRTNIADSD
jgi:hypothetical protein